MYPYRHNQLEFRLYKMWVCPHLLLLYVMALTIKATQHPNSDSIVTCDQFEKAPALYDEHDVLLRKDFKSVQNCEGALHFYCKADYPVEWIQEYDYSQDTSSLLDMMDTKGKTLWTERALNTELLEGRFWNSTSGVGILNQPRLTKSYTACLNIAIQKNSACLLANFTCRSVQKPCLQSRIVSEKLNTSIEYTYSTVYHEPIQEVFNSTCKAHLELGFMNDGNWSEPGWRCKSTENGFYTKTEVHHCDAAMHCNGFLKNYKNKCVRRLPMQAGCEGCQRVMQKHSNSLPGTIRCEDKLGRVLAATEYFYPVSRSPTTDNFITSNKIYLDWGEADPNEMIFLEPLPDETYLLERIILTCYVSRYYFSYGYMFALEYGNGTITFFPSGDGEKFESRHANKITKEVQLTDKSLKAVYCIAPVWNSTLWINQSIAVHVQEGSAVTFSERESHITFKLHQKNVTISCVADGRPEPSIRWFFGENQTRTGKELFLPDVSHDNGGTYVCEAANVLGRKRKSFFVNIEDEAADFQKATVVFTSIFAVLVLIVLGLCWRELKIRSEKIRELTDAEVNEFKNGNVAAVENSEYLCTQDLLQSLPYNEEFEIPSKCLYVDPSTVLGSGNFGIVLKGTVYDKHNRRNSSTVAVKTTRPKFDANFFQTLLTEVKIMAYIGRHANIVSLIGACTENIKNRQIYIAVEYCSQGSLEMFLKGNRTSFVNLVCGDTIHMNTSFCTNEGNITCGNLQSSLELSTVHLLKWAREIANGMDFLGSKKIVHGDLATRNILLTDDLVAKIGDFGLSRVLMKYSNYTRSTKDDCFLAFKWMAPETLLEMKFSPCSDIWSYGVTIWELFTLGEPPYPGLSYSSGFIDWLRRGHRLHKPFYASSQIYNIMMDCWHLEPCQRTSFVDLKDFFEGIFLQTSTTDYVDTKLIETNQYVNGNESGMILAQNPGYSLISNMTFEDVTDSDGDVDPEEMVFQGDTATDEFHGYLTPLKLDFRN